MKRQQSGFTLIELVMVIVILGILAASFAPKFVDLSSDSYTAKKAAVTGAAKSALTVSIAELKRNPDVTELAARVTGGTVTADPGGLNFGNIDGTAGNEIAPTFTSADCAAASVTTATTDTVRCVGSIP